MGNSIHEEHSHFLLASKGRKREGAMAEQTKCFMSCQHGPKGEMQKTFELAEVYHINYCWRMNSIKTCKNLTSLSQKKKKTEENA